MNTDQFSFLLGRLAATETALRLLLRESSLDPSVVQEILGDAGRVSLGDFLAPGSWETLPFYMQDAQAGYTAGRDKLLENEPE